MDDCKVKGTALHVMGLLSDGGVHSHIEHIFALLDMARQRGVEKIYVHAFLDGRDVPPASGRDFVARLQDKCQALGSAKIGVISGRYYAMDRDKRWDLSLIHICARYGQHPLGVPGRQALGLQNGHGYSLLFSALRYSFRISG